MNIKYYYEAKSQKELDYLLEYCEKVGFKGKGNLSSDFSIGHKLIGISIDDDCVYCTKSTRCLQGELTTDIEVFKAQFKKDRTISDIEREMEALLKEKDELEAAEPLELTWEEDGIHAGRLIPIQPWCNNGIWVQTTMFDMKTRELKDGSTIITLHKKLEQCN